MVIYRITGAMFFGAVSAVGAALDRIGDGHQLLVIDFAGVTLVDSSAANMIEGLAHKAARQGVAIYLTGAAPGAAPRPARPRRPPAAGPLRPIDRGCPRHGPGSWPSRPGDDLATANDRRLLFCAKIEEPLWRPDPGSLTRREQEIAAAYASGRSATRDRGLSSEAPRIPRSSHRESHPGGRRASCRPARRTSCIITDDVGFAVPSTFGGVIPTPTIDSSPRKA